MANHQIPRAAQRVERHHGVDDDGNAVTLTVYRHTRKGHARHMFYVVQYRWAGRVIDRSTRTTREITGPNADAVLEAELAEARQVLADSRVRASRRGPA